MAATIRSLLQGTLQVLPDTVNKAPDGNNSPLLSLEIQPFKGINNTVICAKQAESGKNPRPDYPGSNGIYTQYLRFTLADNRTAGKDKPKSSDSVKVTCNCAAYYYYYWFYNKQNGCHEGRSFKPYTRKTPVGTGRAENNPQHLPGLCKHLVYVIKELKRRRKIE